MYTALLTAIVTWISANLSFRQTTIIHIKLVPAVQITSLRYTAFTPAQREILSVQTETGQSSNSREVVAIYDDLTKTIFLPDTWKGETAADLSVLVHEMVHHLQNSAGKKYNCAGAREELAYAAQDKWLNLFGRSLSSEFQLMRLHSRRVPRAYKQPFGWRGTGRVSPSVGRAPVRRWSSKGGPIELGLRDSGVAICSGRSNQC